MPDSMQTTASVAMEFHYRSSFVDKPLPGAYERLLLDVLQGDAALFTRNDEIELAWSLVDPVLQGWYTAGAPPLVTYEPGSEGPAEAVQLLAQAGRNWQLGCGGHTHGKISI